MESFAFSKALSYSVGRGSRRIEAMELDLSKIDEWDKKKTRG